MNRFDFMGRLTRDPVIRYTTDNVCIASFSLAVDKRFKRDGQEKTADFFELQAFGKLAEFVEKYLKQGTKVIASGRIENNNYTRQDGARIYGYSFIAQEIEFCEKKSGADPRPETEKKPEKEVEGAPGFMHVPEGSTDLPFA